MSDTFDLIMAVYPSIDTAQDDFDDLVALVESKTVASDGVILVEHAEDGEVNVFFQLFHIWNIVFAFVVFQILSQRASFFHDSFLFIDC